MYTGKQYEKNYKRLKNLTEKQLKEMHEITRKAIARFEGNSAELETAMGMFYFGHHVGWKVLVMIHRRLLVIQN